MLNKYKNLRWLLALAGLLIVLGVGLLSGHKNSPTTTSACGAYRVDKKIKIGSQTLSAEVASTTPEQSKGLTGRPCIGKDQAMLFVFASPNFYRFWMKDMKFPIDIIWIAPDHKTVGVERDVEPSTYPSTFRNRDQKAQYVLELKSNRSTSLGINLGTVINF